MIPRKLGIPQFFIDANRINAPGKLSEMNLLERWNQGGVISIPMPWDAQLEAEGGNQSQRRKAWPYISPLPSITTDEERHDLVRIQETIFGRGVLSDAQQRDALIVFTAKKYSAILITSTKKRHGTKADGVGIARLAIQQSFLITVGLHRTALSASVIFIKTRRIPVLS
jgi:hypothetical protein